MLSNVYFTSDHHFDHNNILEYQSDTRPFKTIKEMNQEYIDAWNRKVPEEGATVYHLGDFVFGGTPHFVEIARQLHFDKLNVVPGNHDTWAKRKDGMYFVHTEGRRIWVLPLIHQVTVEGQRIVLCHFPMRSWNASYHGSWHLYGHVHRDIEPWGMSMDVGVDGAEGIPYSFEEVSEYMKQREIDLKKLR